MKAILPILMALVSGAIFAQDTLYFEGFEGPDMETYQLYDGNNQPQNFAFGFAQVDYIARDLPENLALNPTPEGFAGNVIGFEDTDGAGFFGIPFITTNIIDISGKENVNLEMSFACPRSTNASVYETTDFLEVDYRVDGASWKTAFYIQGGEDANAYFDLDNNGITDGAEDDLLSQVASKRMRDIPSGATLQIRISMGAQGAHEEFVFDQIVVTGSDPCIQPVLDSLTFTDSICGGLSPINIHGTLNDADHWTVYYDGCQGSSFDTTSATQILAQPKAPYTDYFIRAEGGCAEAMSCDSVRIHVGQSHQIMDTTHICNASAYTFPDGTTIDNIDDSLTYYSVLETGIGCDSIIATTVYVTNLEVAIEISADTLRTSTTADSYQWYDCSGDLVAIDGADSAIYITMKEDFYQVSIEKDGCTATSSCVPYLYIGSDQTSIRTFKFYPNPTTGQLKFDQAGRYGLFNLHGQLIDVINAPDHSGQINPSVQNGLYWIKNLSTSTSWSKVILNR